MSLGAEDEPGDDVEAFEGSSSSSKERKGTTWGAEASGVAVGGGAGCAICRGMAIKGAAGSNRGWKRGTSKSLQKKKYRWKQQVPVIYTKSITGSM